MVTLGVSIIPQLQRQTGKTLKKVEDVKCLSWVIKVNSDILPRQTYISFEDFLDTQIHAESSAANCHPRHSLDQCT